MRTVFNSIYDVLLHWRDQDQPVGRNQWGNVSFENEKLYSYGYLIAVLYPEKKITLLQEDTYSVTTSKHISWASWKSPFPTIRVPEPSIGAFSHQHNIDYFLGELKNSMIKYNCAIHRARWHISDNHETHTDLKTYCEIFNLKMPVTLGLYLDPDYPFIKKRFYVLPNKSELFLPIWLADKGMENIEPRDILKTKNAEIRREIIRLLGIDRICYSLGAKCIDKRGNYELLLLDLRDGRRRPYLKMLNPSVPDIWHLEAVHPIIKTVQEALNYRRYGDDMLERPVFVKDEKMDWHERREARFRFENNPENMRIKKEYQTSELFPSPMDWNPEKIS